MIRAFVRCVLVALGWSSLAIAADPDAIPRAEHPTPDLVRAHWLNLNGPWEFRFDPGDVGRSARWFDPATQGFDKTITVPFGWESELSGIQRPEVRGIAWYRRRFRVPADFPESERVWLHFGAVDWQADVWINGRHVASHEGGYTPFSVDITDALIRDEVAQVTVRAFDPTDPSLPTGKQVGWYTPTSGIWQTVWLESRPPAHIGRFTMTTAPLRTNEPANAQFEIELAGVSARSASGTVSIRSDDPSVEPAVVPIDGQGRVTVPVKVRDPKLWSPDSPHLYPATITLDLKGSDQPSDVVSTYFGLRTIARGRYGASPFERLLLNGKPFYLRAALDQSFNPKGIYTAPSDDFLKRDLELARSFGLNALRIHIKPDEPRRLYWADRLGLLIMEDMPNTWKQDPTARRTWERTMREVVARDCNHPSIITWVAFNETWGLGRPPDYKADRDTQDWVGRMVSAIRALDPSRLVEDNSPCNYDHVENTDLNSWHFYIDDHEAARRHVEGVADRTEPGSGFNYCPGLKQGTAPLINSEYGSVSAGSGDRDISWGFRDLTTLLRRQPKVQGYVYTELDDIEWEHNGFVNYDRSPKVFGYDAFVPGMTVADLQGADFIGYDAPPVLVAGPGEEVTLPVFVSHYSDRNDPPRMRWTLTQMFNFGAVQRVTGESKGPIDWTPYGVSNLEPVRVKLAKEPCVGAIGLELLDRDGTRLAANFVNVVVKPKAPQPRVEPTAGAPRAVTIRFAPGDFARRRWSGPTGNPSGKAWGQGRGYLEYHVALPEAVVKAGPESIGLWAELGSRAGREKVDWPERRNPQDYPQTDARKWPSTVRLSINGQTIAEKTLNDDAADARGVLSHLAKFEHGSHGELLALGGPLSEAVKAELAAGRPLVLRLTVPDDADHAGGLCLFGSSTGAFPSDPSLVVRTRDPLPDALDVDPAAPATIDTAASRQVVLLTPGGSDSRPTRWAYTTTEPGEGWTGRDFDENGWKQGPAGFGRRGTPALNVGTRWDTRAIWLRTTVDLPALGPLDQLTLRLFHDEDVEVYVNGQPLLRESGYSTAYGDRVLDAAQRELFHPGPNLVAVTCRQTQGGQGIDLGLTLDREE